MYMKSTMNPQQVKATEFEHADSTLRNPVTLTLNLLTSGSMHAEVRVHRVHVHVYQVGTDSSFSPFRARTHTHTHTRTHTHTQSQTPLITLATHRLRPAWLTMPSGCPSRWLLPSIVKIPVIHAAAAAALRAITSQ